MGKREIKFDDKGLLTKIRAKAIKHHKERDRHFRALKRAFKFLLEHREFDAIFVCIEQVYQERFK